MSGTMAGNTKASTRMTRNTAMVSTLGPTADAMKATGGRVNNTASVLI